MGGCCDVKKYNEYEYTNMPIKESPIKGRNIEEEFLFMVNDIIYENRDVKVELPINYSVEQNCCLHSYINSQRIFHHWYQSKMIQAKKAKDTMDLCIFQKYIEMLNYIFENIKE